MNKVPISPSAGRSGWAYEVGDMHLPDGLDNGVCVVVVGKWDGMISVRDAAGTVYSLHPALLDCGYKVEVAPGDWRDEADPCVPKMALELLLRFQKAKIRGSCGLVGLDEEMERLTRILIRQASLGENGC